MKRKLIRYLSRNKSILWARDEILDIDAKDLDLIDYLQEYRSDNPKDMALSTLIKSRVESPNAIPWEILKYNFDSSFIPKKGIEDPLVLAAFEIITSDELIKLNAHGIYIGNIELVPLSRIYTHKLNLEDIGLHLNLLEDLTGISLLEHWSMEFPCEGHNDMGHENTRKWEGFSPERFKEDLEQLIEDESHSVINKVNTPYGVIESIEGKYFNGEMFNGELRGKFTFMTTRGPRTFVLGKD